MFKREINSFVRRQRRLTPCQQHAIEQAWPQFGVALTDQPLNLEQLFGRSGKKIVEIGFGMGDALLSMAVSNRECDYVGIEVHEPGIAHVMQRILDNNVNNIRVIQYDAVKIMRNYIPNNVLSRIHLFFPDPWPKKRHHKRRIVQADFVDMLVNTLAVGGVLHFATDWQNYAEQMMRILSANVRLKNAIGEHQFADNEKLQLREQTKFEKRGVTLGHGVFDLLFVK